MDFSSLFDNYFFILHAVLGIVFGVVIYSFKIQSIRYYQMLIMSLLYLVLLLLFWKGAWVWLKISFIPYFILLGCIMRIYLIIYSKLIKIVRGKIGQGVVIGVYGVAAYLVIVSWLTILVLIEF